MPAWHPVPTPVLPLSAARLPGVSTCKLGFNPNHNPGVRMGGGGRAYCCKQGKGTAGDATPSPPSPLPVLCPRKTGLGVSSALRFARLPAGTNREGAGDQRKVPRGRES